MSLTALNIGKANNSLEVTGRAAAEPGRLPGVGTERIRDGIEIARIGRGISADRLEREPSLFTIVNTNSPLKLDTPMLRASLSGGYGLDTSGFALQRVGQPLEIAQGVLYLTCDESSYVTGVALAIDGGRSFH